MMGSLIMLLPFTSINLLNVKAQEYGTYDDDMSLAYPTEDKQNMNVKKVHLKDSLSVQLNFVNMLNLIKMMIVEKIIT